MTSWQKRARLGVAAFGIAMAVVVYLAIGSRREVAPPAPVERVDPKAVLESNSGEMQRLRGARRDVRIGFDRILTYEDGSTVMQGAKIDIARADGRRFGIAAREARSGKDQTVMDLVGDVRLESSDGFVLTTQAATYSQDNGLVRTNGEVSFTKGRLSGAGNDVTYDENADLLTIGRQARVTLTDESGTTTLDFSAGSAILDRRQDRLGLDGMVHVLRDAQTMDADRATAHLSPEEDVVRFLELRGSSRVEGGDGALRAMRARDIDLDYTDDGVALERTVLDGMATIATAGDDGAAGREFSGDNLVVTLAADSSITGVTGRRAVEVKLPAADGAPARTIRADAFDGAGREGAGLTSAEFSDNVEFREGSGTAARVVRSRELEVALDGNAVRDARFEGAVTFEEQGFTAGAADARYEPSAGTLRLTGSDGGGGPRVTDERIAVTARDIDVAIETRKMTASGAVKTTLSPPPSKGAKAADASKLPGLLNQTESVNVTADRMEYSGSGGTASYSGSAALVQGQKTSIRAARIVIDQEKGNLDATGAARALIAQGDGPTDTVDVKAEEIHYDDARRVIGYQSTAGPLPTAGRRGGRGGARGQMPASSEPVRMVGPQGNVSAQRMEMYLEAEGGKADRLEAYDDVVALVNARTATGDRLTYHAGTAGGGTCTSDDVSGCERYVVAGEGVAPVRVVERALDGCRQITGKILTFFKSTDRILVDGADAIRTQTTTGAACAPRPSSR